VLQTPVWSQLVLVCTWCRVRQPGFSGLGTLKADAMKEANDYCTSQEKALKVISTEEAEPPFIFGNFPKAEVQFTCENLNIDEPEDPQS